MSYADIVRLASRLKPMARHPDLISLIIAIEKWRPVPPPPAEDIDSLKQEISDLRRQILERESAAIPSASIGRPRLPDHGVPEHVLRHRINMRRYRARKRVKK